MKQANWEGAEGLVEDVLPTTRAAAVALALRRMIILGQLPPGTRLRQVEIAERFNTSTTPVREAFASLAREGLIHQDAHRGVEVVAPTLDDLYENYEIRFKLEPLATERAAARVSDEVLERLDAVLEEMRGVPLKVQDRRTQLNAIFHKLIYEAAESPRLAEIIDNLRDSAEAYVAVFTSQKSQEFRERADADHAAILKALRAHQPQEAGRAMEQHLRRNVDEIAEAMAASSAGGDAEDATPVQTS